MDTVILAGGRGTRLQSLVDDRPKPMAEVAGRPFMEWLFPLLRSQGLRRVVLATGFMGDIIESHFRAHPPAGLALEYSHETVPLGTAGALRNALGRVRSDRMLVLNGDSYCAFDLARLKHLHVQANAQVTLWLVQVRDRNRYGSVVVDGAGRVVAFREKSEASSYGLVNAGVYIFQREAVEAIPPDRVMSLEHEVFPRLVGRGLYAAIGEGHFMDIGTPEDYSMAAQFLRSHEGG